MTFSQAGLLALYPVMIVLGGLIWMRFLPTLKLLDPHSGTRALVCSLLVLVISIVAEQAYYGALRGAGRTTYEAWSSFAPFVALLKIGYVTGFAYALYAFWLISPTRLKWWSYFAVAFLFWITITAGLML